jgi:N-acetylneuraminic acid mutarotase
LRLKWRRGKDMPFEMTGYPSVVMFKEKVYIGGGATSSDRDELKLMVYEPKQDSWDSLPPYTYRYFSMAIVDDQLVLVGGCEVKNCWNKTNKLGAWKEQSKTWTHPLPPMTTACNSPSVATHSNKWLVVMGGNGDGNYLSRVEILDTSEPVQWYQAASLPQQCCQVPLATIGNMCYLLGGFTKGNSSKKVFSVNLDDLISQTVSQPASESTPPTPMPSPWQSLPDTPLQQSTALAFNGALLAIGGDFLGSSTIHIYQPSSNSWVVAGELLTKRCESACIVLPTGELLIAGNGAYGETRQMIEIASIL